jgi:hypothetical protein
MGKNMNVPKSLVLVSALLVSSCATFQSPSYKKELKPDQSYWMSYDASRRGALIVAKDPNVRICSEPAPDVALSFVNTLKGDYKLPGNVSATDVGVALDTTAQALAGRDNVVLLAREALFRICEAYINGAISKRNVGPMFEEVFRQVAEIAEAQAQKAKSTADAEESRVQQLRLKLQMQ